MRGPIISASLRRDVDRPVGKTVRPSMASPLLSLGRALSKGAGGSIVVHRKSPSQFPTAAIASGVEALDIERYTRNATEDANVSFVSRNFLTSISNAETRTGAGSMGLPQLGFPRCE